MADVFISYAKVDRPEAVALASLLTANGLNVWWDNELHAGDDFHGLILQEISDAKAVVVIWSDASASSRWVRGESSLAAEQSKLIPCHLAGFDMRQVPLHLRKFHSAPLADQRSLLASVLSKIAPAPFAKTDVRQAANRTALEHKVDQELAAEEALEAYNDGVWASAPAEQIEHYNRTIRLNPQFSNAYGNRGRAYYEVGNFVAAVGDFTDAIRLTARGRTEVKPASGGDLFQRIDAIFVASDNQSLARSFYNRALALLALEDYASAVADARRSIRLKSDWSWGHYVCAKVHFATKQFDDALHYADNVLRLEPKFAAAYAIRGLVAYEAGQLDRAREQFEQTLAIAPDFEDGMWSHEIARAKLSHLDRAKPQC